jgi:hypothetical protein
MKLIELNSSFVRITLISAMKRIFTFLFLVVAASCIDPYIPNLKNHRSLLVVDGLITDENNSYKVKLCKSTDQETSVSEMVTDADVYISDGEGIKTYLQNCRNGYYKTDSTSFKGVIGQKYTLHIFTNDGKEYKSEECTMLPVAGIDKLFYQKGEAILGNLGESFTGLKILANTADVQGMRHYLRWTFEEVWKSMIPFPPQYNYSIINDTTYNFEPLPDVKNFCWKRNLSGDIITNSYLSIGDNRLKGQEIQFIAPVKTDRLTKQYSILVKQYSVSEKEFDFWNNLKKAGEAGGDIFDSQPYMVISNIHNVNSAGELVLGYFEVSAVIQKRIFINPEELEPLNLPNYKTDCLQVVKGPDDYPQPNPLTPWSGPFPPSFDDIYHIYTDLGDYTFIRPEMKPGVILAGSVHIRDLVKFVFAPKECTVCGYNSLNIKPEFWIDPEN